MARVVGALNFWPEDAAELADICTGFGEVARGGSSFACSFSVTRSTVLSEAERRRQTKQDAVAAVGTHS
jgi:hypothetical protein